MTRTAVVTGAASGIGRATAAYLEARGDRVIRVDIAGGDVTADLGTTCLVPAFDGALFSQEWKDALWARFYTGAPVRQRRSVERYSIVKRA
ncbi:MAG: hypothetical protein ACSLE1_12370 [Sphingobium sp.]